MPPLPYGRGSEKTQHFRETTLTELRTSGSRLSPTSKPATLPVGANRSKFPKRPYAGSPDVAIKPSPGEEAVA
jgi:hypothetical protein